MRSVEQEPIAKGSVPELALRADDIVVDKHEVAYFRTKVTKYDPVLELGLLRLCRLTPAMLYIQSGAGAEHATRAPDLGRAH